MNELDTTQPHETTASYNSARTKPLFRLSQMVWYAFGLLEALLAIRFILKLLGANPEAGFTNLIYSLTYPFAEPFLGVFSQSAVSDVVFEWTTLLAMAVYALVAWALIKLFVMSKSVSTPEAAVKLDQQDK